MKQDRARKIAALAFAQADMTLTAPSHGARVVQHYTSLDNLWSALLVLKDVDPPRNHAEKLGRVEKAFANLGGFRVRGLGIRDLYQQWLALRYDGMEISPGKAIDLCILGEAVWGLATTHLAMLLDVPPEALKRECRAGFGLDEDSIPSKRVAALRQGIIDGFVRDLGTRMGERTAVRDQALAATCPASYIEAGVYSDRAEVRADLARDPKFAEWVARLYQEFYGLILLKSMKLKEAGINDDWALNVSLAFHGPPAVRIVLRVLEDTGQRDSSLGHPD